MSTTRNSSARTVALVLTVALVAWLGQALHVGSPSASAAEDVGIVDFSYGTSASAPTGDKPQSKLWIADGTWWGSLFDKVSTDYHIFRLSADHRTWTDTGVAIDERASSHMDTLWDGTHLYVVTAGQTETNTSHSPRVLRFSYASGTWSRDAGFPVTLGTGGVEAITIAKDSTGMLWVAFAQGSNVYVQHSTTSDSAWSDRIRIPSDEAIVSVDDIAAVIAYDGNKIGVMWSNERTQHMMFATHIDGTADTQWVTEIAYQRDPEGADDHINLKSLVGDPAGRVFAAVKTSLNEPTDPLIHVLALDTHGEWTSHVFSTPVEQHTRAIIQIDTSNRRVYVFASAPCCSGGNIYMKSAPLDAISFAGGLGTPVIASAANPKVNNPTSTKQNLTSATGLVVLAGDDSTRMYLHADLDLGGAPPDTTPPETTIGTGPADPTGATSATFTFSSSEPGSTFTCSADGAAAQPCTSPWTLTGVATGSHTVAVVATDAAGNTDPTPAQWSWTVVTDTTAPQTTITSGPLDPSSETTATFVFTASEAGGTFACAVDGAAPQPCTSPFTTTALVGPHTFAVAATDAAGNADPSPATWSWSVIPTFTDDFESGALTAGGWVAAVGADGRVAVEPGLGLGGTYALRVKSTSAKGSFAYAQKTLPAATTTFTLTLDLKVLSQARTGRGQLLKAYNASSRILTLERVNSSGQLSITDAANATALLPASVSLGTPTELTLRVKVGTSGSFALWVNGVPVVTRTANLGSAAVYRVRLGTDNLRVVNDLGFDDVVMAR